MHARHGPYSTYNQQPLGGKASMVVSDWRNGSLALEAYGASHVLEEMLTIKVRCDGPYNALNFIKAKNPLLPSA